MDFEKRAFIAASGQVLTEELPENYCDADWKDEEYDDIDEWVVGHAWEPFQYWDADQLWDQISNVAFALKEFHEKEIKLALEETKKDGVAV